MGDFPNVHPLNPVGLISSVGITQPAGSMLAVSRASLASTTWPTASLAKYLPVTVPCRVTAYQLAWYNGAAVSGNVDCGIYDVFGNKLVSTGSTAQAGTSVVQTVDITDTVLTPGNYFLALVLDNTTGTVFRASLNAAALRVCGVAQEAAAFALPATATFAATATVDLPACAASVVATI